MSGTDPAVTPEPAPAAPAASEPISQSSGESEPPVGQAVPYERFRSVNERRKAAEAVAQQQQAQAQQLAQENQTWRQWAAAVQQQQAQQQQAPAQPQGRNGQVRAEPDDPYMTNLKHQLGEDEVGQKALDILDTHAAYIARKNGFVSAAEVDYRIQDAMNRGLGKINSSFQVSNQFQQWINSGLVSPTEGQQLQTQLGSYLQQNPTVAENPQTMDIVVKALLGDAVANHRINPNANPRPFNPLNLSGPGHGPDTSPEDAPLDTSKMPFARLRNLDPAKAKQLVDLSVRAHKGAMS